MAAQNEGPSVLVVAPERDDRRVLFDMLDGEVGRVRMARSVAHSRQLLEDDPELDLLVIEFVGDAHAALALCMRLRGGNRATPVPVLGIVASDPSQRVWGFHRTPPGVAGWLRRPFDADELRVRIGAACRPAKPAPEQRTVSGKDKDLYRFAFEQGESALVVSDPDTGAIIDVNPAFARRCGFQADKLAGQPLRSLLVDGFPDHAGLRGRLDGGGVVRCRCSCRCHDGRVDPVEVVCRPALRSGQVVHVVTVIDRREVAAARSALELLAQLQGIGSGREGMAAAASLLANTLALDYVAVFAIEHDQADGIVQATLEQRIEADASVPDPRGEPMLKLVLDGEAVIQADRIDELAADDAFVRGMGFAAFAGLPLVDDRRRVLGALLAGSRRAWAPEALVGETLRVAASRFGVNMELREAREQGRVKGLLDGLTGLPNRLLFNDRLETTLREADRTGEHFAVMFVDLDRFKSINDSLGHSVGDQVLVAAARRLTGCVRRSDTVARYAGDEFTLILRHISQREDVRRIAEKIVLQMAQPLTLEDGSEIGITASVGVSFYPDDASTSERLLKHADVAMYNAKHMGRNKFQEYVAGPDDPQRQRIALEAKLRQAEKNGELRVYYQPQMDAHSQDIVGMEALVRWEHPELGMISPGFFIPLAEETGLIISIGEWVLRRACAETRAWQRRYRLPLRIGVNLSALQLTKPDLSKVVASALRESGLPASSLELEVTESISVKSIPNVRENLDALHRLGCGISIDDFGTGQSSLDYLRRLPADRIKIDQSFVRNIGLDPDDEAIVRATIGMAHSLKRSVVAEGVETEAHLEFLCAHQCDELQGYLFCRPLAAEAFDQLLAERESLLGGEGGQSGGNGEATGQ